MDSLDDAARTVHEVIRRKTVNKWKHRKHS